VAIVGAGGVGGVLAASLALAGKCSLIVVARGSCLERLQTSELRVQRKDGTRVAVPVQALSAEEATSQNYTADFVLVCTKAHQLFGALPAIKAVSGPCTIHIPCTNGVPPWFLASRHGRFSGHRLLSVDSSGDILRAMPVEQTLGCVGFVSGDVVGDYEVWATNWPDNSLTVGSPYGAGSGLGGNAAALASAALQLKELFGDGHGKEHDLFVQINISDEIHARVWDKLLINCSMNPLSALTRLDCGSIVACDRTVGVLRALVHEVAMVGAGLDPPLHGLKLDADAIVKLYTGHFGLRPSMLQDAEAGKTLESSPILHAAVELGELLGVATPTVDTIARLLDGLEGSLVKS